MPVNVSVNGDLLRFSDPRFIATLHRGVRLILWGILVGVIGVIMAIAVSVISRPAMSSPAVRLLPLAGAVLNIIGAWLLTTPDPSGIGEDRYGTARKVIRFALLADIVNQVISFGNQLPVPPAAYTVLQVITALCSLVGLIGMFAQLQYLEKLAFRLPDQSLSDRARQVKWGYSLAYGVIVLVRIPVLLLGRGGPRGSGVAMTVGCVGGIAGIVMLVYAITYLFLLINFSRALAHNAELARENWAAAT